MNFMKKLIAIFVVLGVLASTIVIFNRNNDFKLYVYEILLEENPKLAYRICLNNLDNKKTKIIATSYDTLEEMTIPEIMIFYARKKSAFTKEQMNKIYEEIISNIDKRRHLYGFLTVYFLENEKNPNPRFYTFIRNEMENVVKNPEDQNPALLNYFSNYNKSEDRELIKIYIQKAVFNENPNYNFTMDYIIQNPREEYFPIIKEYFNKRISGNKFRSDEVYFELEQITKAFLKYPNPESKNILNQIVFNTKYYSSGDFISNNEQIYILLKENDKSNYFIEIKKKLENKIDKTNLQKIIDWNNRWNKK